MRHNQFAAIFRYAQGGAVQHAVQACCNFRGCQVDLIQQQKCSVVHGKRKRAVFKGHVAVFDRQMTNQVGKLQPPMSGDLKDWIF